RASGAADHRLGCDGARAFRPIPGPGGTVPVRPNTGLGPVSPLGGDLRASAAPGWAVEVRGRGAGRRCSTAPRPGRPVPGGGTRGTLSRDGVNVTQKSVGLLASGRMEIGRRTYALDGGVVGLDGTHGFLARHTRWNWAMGCGRLDDGTPLGFNLVAGFNAVAG